jgi:hypothetical protein
MLRVEGMPPSLGTSQEPAPRTPVLRLRRSSLVAGDATPSLAGARLSRGRALVAGELQRGAMVGCSDPEDVLSDLVADLHHMTLLTADLDRLIDFYERIFDAGVMLDRVDNGRRHALIEIGPAPFRGSGECDPWPSADLPARAARPLRAERDQRGSVP